MSTDPQLWAPPLRQGSVSDLIAQRILDLIAGDRLRPGERLPAERKLATLLGTSRPSVREALRSLSARGYVDIRHGAGVFVAEPGTTRSLRGALFPEEMTLAELFDMREVLELPAAAWAARHGDPRRLAAVAQAGEALQAASLDVAAQQAGAPQTGAPQTVAGWRALGGLDAAFHLRIVEAAGNRFLTGTLGVLQEILAQGMETTLRVPGRLEQSRREHQRILNALLAGDPAAARRAAAAHIRGARQAAFARLRETLADQAPPG